MSPSAPERRVFGVSQFLKGLSNLLDDRVGRVWVSGEISNLFSARSGHIYFTLKDDGAQIRAAFFRSAAQRCRFELEEGLEVVVEADASIYASRGELQLVVRQLEPRGVGALQLAFEQLRARLEAEGLFDADRKRALPSLPRAFGIVTSPDGAALRDVLKVSGGRFPGAPVLLSPTRVQGEGSEDEIAAALDRLSERDDIDVVLIVRGGGSLEDLWAFNTETVARAIARCPHPVIAGVGHETDFTIADAVADARAATPSAAAALALPDRAALADRLLEKSRRLDRAARSVVEDARALLSRERDALRMLAPSTRLAGQRARLVAAARGLRTQEGRVVERARERVRHAADRLALASPDLARRRQRLQHLGHRLRGGVASLSARETSRLGLLAGRLDSLSPLAVLGRGYALARRSDDGRVVRDAADVGVGDRLILRVARAEIEAEVTRVEAREPAASGGSAAAAADPPSGRGSL